MPATEPAISGEKTASSTGEDPLGLRRPATERSFIQVPTDLARPAVPTFEAGYWGSEAGFVPGGAAVALPVVLAALTALLHRYTQQDELALDLFFTIDYFLAAQLEGTSLFAPLNVGVSSGDTLAATTEAFGLLLGSQADWRRIGGGRPFAASTNIAISLVPEELEAHGPEALRSRWENLPPYELHFLVPRRGTLGRFGVVYNERLFGAQTAARMLDSWGELIRTFQAAPGTPIGRLGLLTGAELAVLRGFADGGQSHYEQVPAHRVFERKAREQPSALAAAYRDLSITYGELEERSNRLAHFLIAQGATGPESRVAVCVMPGFDILVSILAIFKAGAVYVPLDPTHPEAMIARILDEVAPRIVLTQTAVSAVASPQKFRHFCFDRDGGLVDELHREASSVPAVNVTLDHPSHVFYTSGTTGRPKGVLALHRNVAHFVQVPQQRYGFCATDAFSSIARYTFSISFFELLFPLCCGGHVRLLDRDTVLDPARLARVVADLTVLHAGPSLLSTLFKYLRENPATAHAFPRMRHVSTGGDLVPAHVLEQAKQVFPNAEIFVIYGCTEINCMGIEYLAARHSKITKSYIGKPFPGVKSLVLDADDNIVPRGAVGEICVAGNGVVSGYLDRPELTAEKFRFHEGARYYHTGDMGRLDEDGNIEILGRRDFQVQIRGIRIELAGIENTVRDLGLADRCAVVVRKLDEQDQRLIAFVTHPRVTDIAEFRAALAKSLPDYMLPQGMVVLDALPVTSNGKLDRNRLNELEWHAPERSAEAGPSNSLETVIAGAFAMALGRTEVGVDANFFDLGGHSLSAIKALKEIENRVGIQIPPAVIFEHNTVRALARHSLQQAEPSAILLNDNEQGLPIFLVLGVHIYRELALRLSPDYSVYAVLSASEFSFFDEGASRLTVEELASEYLKVIRRQQPHGPYRIAGFSFGGVIAYELALQLRDAGEETVFVGLLDSMLPEWRLGWQYRFSQIARFSKLTNEQRRRVVGRAWERTTSLARGRKQDKPFLLHPRGTELGKLERIRRKAYDTASAAYMKQIRPLAGVVTLIAAGRRLEADPLQSSSCGWAEWVPLLDVSIVEASHDDILTDAVSVDQVADVIRTAHRRRKSAAPRSVPGVQVPASIRKPPVT